MAGRLESGVVYAAGAVQGIVLVTFPAASTIFETVYGLSNTQYGMLFLPQVVLAVLASLLGGVLAQKPRYLAGLCSSLVAMALLLLSTAREHNAYPILLCATGFVGLGFGLTVPALNSLIAAFHPGRVDRSVLVLNALLGVGTVLAPLFVALFVGLGFWWGLPVVSVTLLAVILALSLPLPLLPRSGKLPGNIPSVRPSRGLLPGNLRDHGGRFMVYAGFAVLYGICETLNGNWAQEDMTQVHHATDQRATWALTAFWAMVTLGRVLFALARRLKPAWTYHVLPFALAAAFLLIAALPAGQGWAAVGAFGLAGLACSALLPLTISFGQEEMPAAAAAVAGGVIAFYQLGYGIAAFGVGPLADAGVRLPQIFAWAAVAALAMGLMSFAVTFGRTPVG